LTVFDEVMDKKKASYRTVADIKKTLKNTTQNKTKKKIQNQTKI
jgi:hypothetical protein